MPAIGNFEQKNTVYPFSEFNFNLCLDQGSNVIKNHITKISDFACLKGAGCILNVTNLSMDTIEIFIISLYSRLCGGYI